jgi:transcriptional regulator of acetoin/glycerol metabolism
MKSPAVIERQRLDFFERGISDCNVRMEVGESWLRSKALGILHADSVPPEVPVEHLDQSIVRFLSGPLGHYAVGLNDTGLALLLTDRNGTILQRWSPESRISAALDEVNSVPGAVLSEATVGTNGIGTPLAARRPVEISHAEHVAGLYHSMSCAGAPINDPFTGNLLGAVAIAGKTGHDDPSLMPVLKRLLTSLSSELLNGRSEAQREYATAGSAIDGLTDRNPRRRSLYFPPAYPSPLRPGLHDRVEHIRSTYGLCLIVGEPGSGKSTLAGGPTQPDSLPVRVLDGPMAEVQGSREWLRDSQASLSAPGTVVIRHVFTLTSPALLALKSMLARRHPGCAVFLTSIEAGTVQHAHLGAARLDVPALRDCPLELRSMLESAAQGQAWSARPFVVDEASRKLLLSYAWPGNLAEFSATMEELGIARPGVIRPADLPSVIRQQQRTGGLLRQSESEAIDRAIEAADGNMSEAARLLGIGRATLYRRLQERKESRQGRE